MPHLNFCGPEAERFPYNGVKNKINMLLCGNVVSASVLGLSEPLAAHWIGDALLSGVRNWRKAHVYFENLCPHKLFGS